MSLVVWLPLTKDLRQQGLSNVTVTNNGATYSATGGKLGGCYKFTSSGNNLSIPANAMNNFTASNGCSLAFWIKLNTWYSSYATFFQAGTGSSPWSNYIFGVLRNASNSTVCFTIGNGSSASQNSYLTSAWETGVWFHMAFTYETGKCKIYKNGVLDKEYTTSIVPDFSKITKITVGRCNNETTYHTDCEMNDIRIYDHCLSPMEVKQISQGLVLHYPLNRNGWGQENLLKNSHIKLDNNGYYVGTYSFANSEEIVAGETYTLSFNGELQDDSQTGWYFNIFPSPYTAIINKSTDKEGRFAFSFVMPENNGNHTAIGCYSTPLGNRLGCAIWNVKLEKGSTPTPWCPNSADTLATTMGLNSTTEYDCSGFCNNGTRTGTFTWTSDTPKYAVSQVFNGTDNAIQTPSLPTMIADKNYTIAVWIYKTVIGSKGYQTIYGGPSGFEIEARNGSANETKFVPWNWGKPMASYELNEWNHCVFVHSDADCKIYLNGEYIATGTAKASNPTGNYFVGAWSTATQQNFDGLMSDFRIYATALSASDVKSLYQNCATIDPDGTIRGQIRS